jgi:hypothetical protein
MLIALAIFAIIVLAIIVVADSRPDMFHVQRSREIAAQPERISALIQDFHAWTRWSPYEKKDPNLKRAYSGSATGVGSIYAWEGNRNVGSGRMEILAAAAQKTTIKLDFFKPFKASNTAEFTLEPSANGTRVTWAMFGETKFFCKVMSLFMNMDKMCGRDFEAGLAAMEGAATGPDGAAEGPVQSQVPPAVAEATNVG